KQTLKYIDKLAQAFHSTRFGTGDYSNYGEIIDTLMIAIEDRQVVTLAYQSQHTTEPAERDVHPYHLVYHKGTLYLVAWAVDREDVRNYKVDRISNATADARALPFVPIEFDLDQYLAGSFGIYRGKRKPTKVSIQFQPSVVRYVEEKHWHESEKLTRQADGTLLAEFVLTSFEEVKSWIFSFGPNARVLEPPELVQEIREDLNQMARCYAAPAAEQSRTKSIPKKSSRATGKVGNAKENM
ncbi:MAG: Transcriptional regulator, DeoR family, partial [Planctomycetaceae bacterium]|nr:Transcriptional regulator, DeoR family [Planctomycetaceae bacterium]